MSLTKALLPEYDHEMKNTRKTIERVPEDKLGWKPHEKSPTMGWLATHLAHLPLWAISAIEKDSLDLAPGGVPIERLPEANSRNEIIERFDKNVAAARAAIAGASDEHLLQPWSLLMNGKTVMTLPRMAVLRSFVMNHGIHHRAQLGVYLRLNNVPVPAIYGPSADEGAM
ncbi:MAG: DinB family protein [Acidobacteria bacterium]|nr:DinB family protein [Acidobacteriota bacterium]MBI3663041.1 DinB family protein [Acidobacteriota bacterium]